EGDRERGRRRFREDPQQGRAEALRRRWRDDAAARTQLGEEHRRLDLHCHRGGTGHLGGDRPDPRVQRRRWWGLRWWRRIRRRRGWRLLPRTAPRAVPRRG